ncbi:alpha/beta fold hydrolase [Amycolatopsis australiensis]|uniref:prolyl aminopeptidase n=1 Tax=Amycolatopsis australiensis TaxID=546364 RepID=A0A1K1Q0L9_9PSEU|nr:alpha/beta hydrolase [Amycolatopsis australiensis]SFW53281.1 Pimeloyl-ACP methyl ester carboxylesterase [Amycolatopsis australiensis]
MRSKLLTAGLVLALTAALGGVAAADARPGGRPKLADPHPCPGQPGFTCSTLTVPLDHTGRVPGTLDLPVATADNVTAPKGVLLFLTGGPGQGGVGTITRIATKRLPEVAKDYRFVMLDQRGTGAGALRCPGLQAQMGSSDIATPARDAVTECARILGRTAPLYSTDQSVADFDDLRQALGVPKMVVDGVSYGSFTAARYAIAHPDRVRKVVLDSVLPHHATSSASLYLTGLTAESRVLRAACAAPPACGYDPAEDLAWVVRHRSAAEGVKIFDAIVAYEFADPTYRAPAAGDVLGALHEARGGAPARFDQLVADYTTEDVAPESFSAGLHAATLCADQRFPWGSSETPMSLRQPLLSLAARTLPPSATWPYTTEVATQQGFIQSCLPWPVERVGSNPASRLPDVPVLLLNGDRDLSTPLEWARQEAAQAPKGKLVIVPGESHSIQNRERGHAGRDAVIGFLAE